MGAAPQLLVDLSVLVHKDDQSGVQRVVRNLLAALLAAPPAGYQVVPVCDAGGHYAYARRYPGAPGGDANDADANADDGHDGDASAAPARPIHVRAGDIFLGLDLCPDQVPGNRAVFEDLRRHGVRIYFVVYDLLPLTMPEMFAAGASPWFTRWLETVAGVADGLLCISRAVADEVLDWLARRPQANPGVLNIGHFPLGADLDGDPAAGERAPARDEPDPAEPGVLARLDGAPAFLMVGTIEPRKMHAQALDAFEQWWARGGDAALVIVGKPGWMTETLVARLEGHAQRGRRLFWLRHASDATLLRLYRGCTALLAASAGEGYGLPLIEAARHGLPIVARDLAVFRELCGAHASYFTADDADALAGALARWLDGYTRGCAPDSALIATPGWSDSARALSDIMLGQRWIAAAPSWLP